VAKDQGWWGRDNSLMEKKPSRIHSIADPRRSSGEASGTGNVRRYRLGRLSADVRRRLAAGGWRLAAPSVARSA